MLRCWLRLMCLLLLGGAALSSHAQETTTYSRPQVPFPDPVIVLNSTIIINGVLADFTAAEAKETTSVLVYKGPDAPDAQRIAPHLRYVSPTGLIDITSPKRIRSKSFRQLSRQLGLHGPLVFALNGHPLDELATTTLRIAPGAIGQIHIVRPTPEVPETRVDVWLVSPRKTDYTTYPAGTIFLR